MKYVRFQAIQAGYTKGTKLFAESMLNDEEYENRIIVITNVMPNFGQISTLFQSNSNSDGETKGGVILIKLKRIEKYKTRQEEEKINLAVSYKDKKGKEHSNSEEVKFNKIGDSDMNQEIKILDLFNKALEIIKRNVDFIFTFLFYIKRHKYIYLFLSKVSIKPQLSFPS